VVEFVDDLRPSGGSRKEVWQAARRVASMLSWLLGMHDAPRKQRDSSQSPGGWTGSVVRTGTDVVFLLASEEKWKKGKEMILEMEGILRKDPLCLLRKRLEQIRGFLVHVAQTYPAIKLYLIEIHVTIDSWRTDCDWEGWRVPPSRKVWVRKGEDSDWEELELGTEVPEVVKAIPQLEGDLLALGTRLLAGDVPQLRRYRSRSTGKAQYGFGDASGSSFGSSFEILSEGVEVEYGQWTTEDAEEPSNWKELNNLVCALEGVVARHSLIGCEFFIFTNNSTAEGAFWRGTSRSKKLFDLVL
jgi:hypothetical protein